MQVLTAALCCVMHVVLLVAETLNRGEVCGVRGELNGWMDGGTQGLDATPRQPLLVEGAAVPPSRRLLPRLAVPADGQTPGLFGALLRGVAGVLSEPIRCRQCHGCAP